MYFVIKFRSSGLTGRHLGGQLTLVWVFFGVAEAVSRWLCNFGVCIVKSVSTKFFVLPCVLIERSVTLQNRRLLTSLFAMIKVSTNTAHLFFHTIKA